MEPPSYPPTSPSTTSNTTAVSSLVTMVTSTAETLCVCGQRDVVLCRLYEWTRQSSLLTVWVSLLSVYREDVNAPQRHLNRHNKEEPKARPLRVGDTEKPGPEGKRTQFNHWSYSALVYQLHGIIWPKDRHAHTYVPTYMALGSIPTVSHPPCCWVIGEANFESGPFIFHSRVATQPSQTAKQWEGYWRLPLWEVQEDEPQILTDWMSFEGNYSVLLIYHIIAPSLLYSSLNSFVLFSEIWLMYLFVF